MPLKVQDNAIRFSFSPFVFFDGFAKRVSKSFSCIDTSLSRIPRLLPIDIELDDKGFFGRQRNAGVVEFKHSCLTPISVERPVFLTEQATFLKHFVLQMFYFLSLRDRLNSALFLFGLLSDQLGTIFGFVNKNRLKIKHLVDSKANIVAICKSTVGKQIYTELSPASQAGF